MNVKIDHVTVCSTSLELCRQAFAGAGLTTTYGGPHANGVTHMAMLGFEDGSYLELIAPYQGQVQQSPWAKLMLDDSGAGAWAVATDDIHADVARLRNNNIETAGPFPGNRSRPDGIQLQWETASAGPGSMGAVLPFMIQDHTPRDLRIQPSPNLAATGITGVAAVVIGVKDINTSAALFRQAYGWDAPLCEEHPESGAKLAYFPGAPVMFASPLQSDSWLGARLEKFGEAAAMFLLKTPNLQSVAKRFSLSHLTRWFGRDLAWFEMAQLPDLRLGLIED